MRLVHYTYLPLALSVVTDPQFFLNNPYTLSKPLAEGNAYSDARTVPGGEGYRWINGKRGSGVAYWYGRLFPDMLAFLLLPLPVDVGEEIVQREHHLISEPIELDMVDGGDEFASAGYFELMRRQLAGHLRPIEAQEVDELALRHVKAVTDFALVVHPPCAS